MQIGFKDRLDPETVARFIARFTGFTVKADTSGEEMDDRITLPITFERLPPEDLLTRLGLRIDEDIDEKMSIWTRLMTRLSYRKNSLTCKVLSFAIAGPDKKHPREVLTELMPYGPTLLPEIGKPTSAQRDLRQSMSRTAAMATFTIPILILVWADLPKDQVTTRRWTECMLATIVQGLAWPLFRTSFRVLWYLHIADLGLLASLSTCLAWSFSVVAFGFELAGMPFAEPFFETSALLLTLIYVGRTIQLATRRVVGSAIEGLRDLQMTQTLLVQKSNTVNEETVAIDIR